MNKIAILFTLILLASCESLIEEDSRIDVRTIGVLETNSSSAIVAGSVSIIGSLPNEYDVVGRGIIYGKNESGLEIKTCTRGSGMDYNSKFECTQFYFYTPYSADTVVQSIEIYYEMEKDDGSLYGYEFRQIGNIGEYKCLLTGLAGGSRYYARAFSCIRNERDNTYSFVYGDIIEFITSGIQQDPTVFIEIPALKLGVMKYDYGTSQLGSEAERLCSYVNFYDGVGGYLDWRLPTLDELQEIYKLRHQVGGFKNEKYWSSTKYGGSSSLLYYFWDFNYNTSGHQTEAGAGQFTINANIRLVRTIK